MSFTPFGFSSYCPWRPENRLTSRTPLTFTDADNNTLNMYETHYHYTNQTNQTNGSQAKQTYETLLRLELMEGQLKALEEKLTSFAQQLEELQNSE